MKTRLNRVPVLFDPDTHTYTNEETGELLSGITGTLLKRLFPSKYDGVPKDILAKAAEKGSNVHASIELYEKIGVTPSTQEGKAYADITRRNGMVALDCEYTVTDFKHYASQIDVIYEVQENVVDLADIKTTYKFDEESVSWQLSIYAYMMSLCNPHVKVRKLLGIWLRGDTAQIIEVKRHTDEEVIRLIESDMADKDDDIPATEQPLPDYIKANIDRLYEVVQKKKELQEEEQRIKSEILDKMSGDNLKSIDAVRILFTVVKERTKRRFDEKRFKEEHSELFNEYQKEITEKETLKITLRNDF